MTTGVARRDTGPQDVPLPSQAPPLLLSDHPAGQYQSRPWRSERKTDRSIPAPPPAPTPAAPAHPRPITATTLQEDPRATGADASAPRRAGPSDSGISEAALDRQLPLPIDSSNHPLPLQARHNPGLTGVAGDCDAPALNSKKAGHRGLCKTSPGQSREDLPGWSSLTNDRHESSQSTRTA